MVISQGGVRQSIETDYFILDSQLILQVSDLLEERLETLILNQPAYAKNCHLMIIKAAAFNHLDEAVPLRSTVSGFLQRLLLESGYEELLRPRGTKIA
ncbi:MAG: hypothetical protein FWE76_04675 [Symbiobacteriaceae bacterium]|nr:hypothetical protein [Symbiobacteriaceae bacterium]